MKTLTTKADILQANLRRDQRRLAREGKKDWEANKPRNKTGKKQKCAGRQPALDRATTKADRRNKAKEEKSSAKLPPLRNVTSGAGSSFTLADITTSPRPDKKRKREQSSLELEVEVLVLAPPTSNSTLHRPESLDRLDNPREDQDRAVAGYSDSGPGPKAFKCGFEEWLSWGNRPEDHPTKTSDLSVEGPGSDQDSGPEAQDLEYYEQQEARREDGFGNSFQYSESAEALAEIYLSHMPSGQADPARSPPGSASGSQEPAHSPPGSASGSLEPARSPPGSASGSQEPAHSPPGSASGSLEPARSPPGSGLASGYLLFQQLFPQGKNLRNDISVRRGNPEAFPD
ncbi:hypothetical protein MMC07_004878 [Pseudocyphellaria aurata]|nr:hypothetical protein [Pseudocyphellaria aurata]